MKIKNKVTLGIIFLFVEFLVMALFGAGSIYNISQQSEKIMKDNSVSMQYAETMLQTIDQINALQLAILFNPAQRDHRNELVGLYEKFEESLSKESNNITEPGERELLQALNQEYKSYKVSVAEMDAVKDKTAFYFQKLLSKHQILKSKIYSISDINFQMIIKKNESVNRYERHSYVFLTIIASLLFLFSIVFLFNFPSMISKPVMQLLEILQGVAEGRYDIHPHHKSTGEFREMEDAIRTIAERLKKYEDMRPGVVFRGREKIADTIDRALEKLRINHERIGNLEIRRAIDEQSQMIATLRNDLELAKHDLMKT
jgi:nitrogen fixation/metabolism regulation signal transduction histidine kinase